MADDNHSAAFNRSVKRGKDLAALRAEVESQKNKRRVRERAIGDLERIVNSQQSRVVQAEELAAERLEQLEGNSQSHAATQHQLSTATARIAEIESERDEAYRVASVAVICFDQLIPASTYEDVEPGSEHEAEAIAVAGVRASLAKYLADLPPLPAPTTPQQSGEGE